jgi:hypothetical protein
LMWGSLSDEKSGLYFSVFVGHRQRSLSQIWVPRDSWAYFIVSIFENPQTLRARVPSYSLYSLFTDRQRTSLPKFFYCYKRDCCG